MDWLIGERRFDLGGRTLVMGVLNVTPDSFSDGGLFNEPDLAVEHAREMVADGADIIDIGGESTRPGAEPVSVEDEVARTVPVIEALRAQVVPAVISIDTRKAAVAEAALAAGAQIVNDVSAGENPAMFETVAQAGAAMALMHMQGDPQTMQEAPTYDDVVTEVRDHLAARVEAAVAAGVAREGIAVDPGIGFGKTVEHNLSLMKHLDMLASLDRPILVGPSRKSFIGKILGVDVDERLEGTAAATAYLAARGAHIVRVHDVREMTRVVRIVDAIQGAS